MRYSRWGAVRKKKARQNEKMMYGANTQHRKHTENILTDIENRNEKSKQIPRKKQIKWLAKIPRGEKGYLTYVLIKTSKRKLNNRIENI